MTPWLGVVCPRCSGRIRLSGVRDIFVCPTCGLSLNSNSSIARLLSFLICVVLVPLAWALAGAIAESRGLGYGTWRALVALFGFASFVLLYRGFLRLRAERDPDSPSSLNG
jgi:hypothetical protein